jgi:hypothetical protein
MLDGFGRGLPRFSTEGATELAWAQAGDLGQLLDGQCIAQIGVRMVDRLLDPVGFRIEVKQRGELRLPAGAAMINDKLAGYSA